MNTNFASAAIGYILGFDEKYESVANLGRLFDLSNLDMSIENIYTAKHLLDARESHYQKYSDKIEDLPAPWYYFFGGGMFPCHGRIY